MDKNLEKEVNKLVTRMATKNNKQLPDAEWHQKVSFIKSGIRILGYIFIPFNISVAVTLLIVSEAVGIIEELV
jgi:hypothetical protein|tara:strand:- start:111 stop:329 length:219 start_codon:yes stop_codon:yes gene_type:complete